MPHPHPTMRMRAPRPHTRADRLPAMQYVAGRVAHDLNNYLTAFLGYGELLRGFVADPEKVERYLGEMLKAADRARTFSQQLQAFSECQVLDARTIDLNEMIRSLGSSLRQVLGDEADLELALDPIPCRVSLDLAQGEQLFLLLAADAAREARDRSRFCVRTSHAEAGADGASGVELLVQDSAPPPTGEARARYFEPFRHREGTGTGLSRAVVFGIVRQHGGQIELAREGGTMRTVRIVLPSMP